MSERFGARETYTGIALHYVKKFSRRRDHLQEPRKVIQLN